MTNVRWETNTGHQRELDVAGFDIHVFNNNRWSRRLDEILWIYRDNDNGIPASQHPTGITIEFVPEFTGAPNNFGVEVNTSTGEVRSLRRTLFESIPRIHNFNIIARITDSTRVFEPPCHQDLHS